MLQHHKLGIPGDLPALSHLAQICRTQLNSVYLLRTGDLVSERYTNDTRRSYPLASARVRRHEGRYSMRLLGAGMPGYWVGWFRMDGRKTRVYASIRDGEGVLIETLDRLYVTPDDPGRFLAACRAHGADAW